MLSAVECFFLNPASDPHIKSCFICKIIQSRIYYSGEKFAEIAEQGYRPIIFRIFWNAFIFIYWFYIPYCPAFRHRAFIKFHTEQFKNYRTHHIESRL